VSAYPARTSEFGTVSIGSMSGSTATNKSSESYPPKINRWSVVMQYKGIQYQVVQKDQSGRLAVDYVDGWAKATPG
jgi:hypothetical protein